MPTPEPDRTPTPFPAITPVPTNAPTPPTATPADLAALGELLARVDGDTQVGDVIDALAWSEFNCLRDEWGVVYDIRSLSAPHLRWR